AQPDELVSIGAQYRGHGRKAVCNNPASLDELAQPLAPRLWAAFYRRSALESIGGLPTALGDDLAEIDVALVLHKAGCRFEVDQDCRVLARPAADSPSGFLSALYSERLFWRHFDNDGWIAGLLAHPLVTLAETVRARPWWRALAYAAGRLLGLMQPGQYRQCRQAVAAALAARERVRMQPPSPSPATQEPAVQSTARQHRIDPPHSSGPPPRTVSPRPARSQQN